MNRFSPKAVSKEQLSSLVKASYEGVDKGAKTAFDQGYRIDRELSNRNHKVFTDKDNNPTVAFTGTRKWTDVGTDLAMAVGLGRFTPRFQESKQIVKDVKAKYQKPVTAVGHSLGGSLAEYSGAKKVVTLDKGVGLGTIGKKIDSKQTDIRTQTDPVSLLSLTQHGGKHVTIPNTAFVNPLQAHDKSYLSRANNRFF